MRERKDWSLEIVTFVFVFTAGLVMPGPPAWAAPVAQRLVRKCRNQTPSEFVAPERRVERPREAFLGHAKRVFANL